MKQTTGNSFYMNDEPMYTIMVDGENISVSLSRARTLCPAELAALEEAEDRISKMEVCGDMVEMVIAGEELIRRTDELLRALEGKVRLEMNNDFHQLMKRP